MRCFISANFDEIDEAARITEILTSNGCMKPVSRDQMHVTFLFYQDLDQDGVDKIRTVLEKVRIRRFRARITGIGGFPSPKRARVGVLFLEDGDLNRLHEFLRENCPSGYDSKRFTPHITLSRSRYPCDIGALSGITTEGAVTFSSLSLVSSRLTSEGPIHSVIERVQLM